MATPAIQSAGSERLLYNYRGTYGQALFPRLVYTAGVRHGALVRRSAAEETPLFLLAQDHRDSSPVLAGQLAAGLSDAGCRVRLLGVVPTPAVARAIARDPAARAGAIITASHNPPQLNGVKFFDERGAVLRPALEHAMIEEVVAACPPGADGFSLRAPQVPGRVEHESTAAVLEEYAQELSHLCAFPEPLRVAIDCRYGLGGCLARRLIGKLGGVERLAILHEEPRPSFRDDAGVFIDPEPRSDNLGELGETIRAGRYDVGLAFDGDADRIVVLDESGAYVDDNHILLSLLLECGGSDRRRAVTVDAALWVGQELARRGLDPVETASGDPFVSAALDGTAGAGGVPNGHYIFASFSPYSDAFLAGAVLLRFVSRLRAAGRTLGDYLGELPRSFRVKKKFPCAEPFEAYADGMAVRAREFLATLFEQVDFLGIDESVVVGRCDIAKLLLRRSRWSNRYEVFSESLVSREEAERHFRDFVQVLGLAH